MDTGTGASSALGHTDAHLSPSIFSEPVCVGAHWFTPQGEVTPVHFGLISLLFEEAAE